MGTLIVDAPVGFCKEVPSWMVDREPTGWRIEGKSRICPRALLEASDVLESLIAQLDRKTGL